MSQFTSMADQATMTSPPIEHFDQNGGSQQFEEGDNPTHFITNIDSLSAHHRALFLDYIEGKKNPNIGPKPAIEPLANAHGGFGDSNHYLPVSFDDLVFWFGYPNCTLCDDEKSDANWVIKDQLSAQVYRIWNWKSGPAYRQVPFEEIFEWHFEGDYNELQKTICRLPWPPTEDQSILEFPWSVEWEQSYIWETPNGVELSLSWSGMTEADCEKQDDYRGDDSGRSCEFYRVGHACGSRYLAPMAFLPNNEPRYRTAELLVRYERGCLIGAIDPNEKDLRDLVNKIARLHEQGHRDLLVHGTSIFNFEEPDCKTKTMVENMGQAIEHNCINPSALHTVQSTFEDNNS